MSTPRRTRPTKRASRANPPLTLVSVSFSGDNLALSDDGGAPYAAPHWSEPLRGSRGRRFPVAYVMGRRPTVGATFRAAGVSAGASLKIRGTDLPAQDAVVSRGVATYPPADATDAFASVQALAYRIGWEVSVDGAAWSPVATSEHRLYVVLGRPADAASLYESAVDVGCTAARGLSDKAEVLSAIWAKFETLDVRRKKVDGYGVDDGARMGYWMNGKPAQSVAAMLRSGNGSCLAWAQLFLEAVWAHGFKDAQIVAIDSPSAFLVRNWRFDEPAPPVDPNQLYRVDVDCHDTGRLPAQNNAKSCRSFKNHYIVLCAKQYYDPSYGAGPFGSSLLHENAASAGVLRGRLVNERDRRLDKHDLTYRAHGRGRNGDELPDHVRVLVNGK